MAGPARQLTSLMILCILGFSGVASGAEEPRRPRVRLAVVIVFDQLCEDYLQRWQPMFEKDGFARLLEKGAWYQNCQYPYANTVTGAGHASVLTGCSPDKHGIIENNWYDRAAGTEAYCATTSRYQNLPNKPGNKKGGGAPDRLLVPTLGDALKEATGNKARVFGMSFKDRGAILPAGHKADGAFWFDNSTGTFVTSNFYRDGVPAWLARFNEQKPGDRWIGKDWTRLRADLDYTKHSGPDDVEGEGKGAAQGRTFPHPMGSMSGGRTQYYEALFNSPQGNELLLSLAMETIKQEKLGADDVPDLLCISFSCNDPIGHCWGPDSQEVFDVTLRSDLIMRDLMAFLDQQVGKDNYAIALSSDHGVCPLPEVSRKRGLDAKRVDPSGVRRAAEAYLQGKFGAAEGTKGTIIESMEGGIYLNRNWLRARELTSETVEEALAEWCRKQEVFQNAYTRTQLLKGVAKEDAVGQRVRKSFHPDRSGDVMPVIKPYYLLSSPVGTGTTHGAPHRYDTHVPLLIYGPGIKQGIRKDEEVPPQTIVPALARLLGIDPPSGCDTPLPRDLFSER